MSCTFCPGINGVGQPLSSQTVSLIWLEQSVTYVIQYVSVTGLKVRIHS